MRLWPRRKRGRHELGAAVVGLPSGPPVGAVPLPAEAPAVVAQAPAAPPVAAPRAVPLPAAAPTAARSWVAPPAPVAPPLQATEPPTAPYAEPPTAPPASPPGAPPLQAASPELLAASVPTQAAPAGHLGPHVELGFRDGSTASLDPSSEQARALEQLARTLTQGSS